jgi:GntR family transcriptional regulator / MocR family aminotransferase
VELRNRITDGTYAVSTALPSTRAMAAERGLSRATVTLVYEQLAADGFIETRAGAASRVAVGVGPAGSARRQSARPAATQRPFGRLASIGERIATFPIPQGSGTKTGEIDFVYGPLAGSDFPTLAWMKALRAVERQRSRRLEYDDPRGSLELHKALQAHLSQTRGLACSVEQLLIVNGSQQALDLCARLLVNPGDGVVVENPGYRMAHRVFEAYGAKLLCVDVDEQGLVPDRLTALSSVQLAYVTPTHQFPLGSFLPIARRRELLAWAHERKAWVIEDDYDSEYRYSVRPEATLMSLDTQGCVIHVGTFSKTLSPQLRLGYMVLPPALVGTFAEAKRLSDRHVATGVQRALALLLEDGSYDRHVRRIRRHQQTRQRALIHGLRVHLGDQIEVQGAASGLHLVVWFRKLPPNAEPALVRAAREHGVCVYPVGPLYLQDTNQKSSQRNAGLIMGYALLNEDEIAKGVRRLALASRQVGTAK